MKKFFSKLGAVTQGLVLGALLAHAVFALATIANGVRLFRYQGF